MKKILLALLILAGTCAVAKADQHGLPGSGRGLDIPVPGFLGVSYASSAFSAELTTVTWSSSTVVGRYTVFGVDYSSGNCGNYDFVDVFDSTSAQRVHAGLDPGFRWYNMNGSTNATVGMTASCSGFSGPKYPVAFERGIFFDPSSTAYNRINLLYYKEGE